jgi:hypothetical protein
MIGDRMGSAQCDMCGQERPYYTREDDMAFWICDECWKDQFQHEPNSILPEAVRARLFGDT